LPETQASRRAYILDRIVETKRREVETLRPQSAELVRSARSAPPPRSLEAALRDSDHVRVIAEVKRRSPGAGEIRPQLDPTALAAGYAANGAAAISVLTDSQYFGGSLEDLSNVRRAVQVPVLRKDFVIDELQVHEARAAGADAVLLIVRILEQPLLIDLLAAVVGQAMTPLVEVHEAEELERAAAAGARVIGINNRDLRTFTTDLDVTLRLLDGVPAGAVVVSESGIRTGEDVDRLGAEGVHGVLVGESLLRADDPARAVAALASSRRTERQRA
jgi:indole-3-glycerol phosphate synthase